MYLGHILAPGMTFPEHVTKLNQSSFGRNVYESRCIELWRTEDRKLFIHAVSTILGYML